MGLFIHWRESRCFDEAEMSMQDTLCSCIAGDCKTHTLYMEKVSIIQEENCSLLDEKMSAADVSEEGIMEYEYIQNRTNWCWTETIMNLPRR